MAKSINITYALVGACHTTFTITDNLGNVVAQGVTGSELTQDFNVLVDDAATSITVHSENCSVTHNLDLPECLLAGIEVTKECSCYVEPMKSNAYAASSEITGFGEFDPINTKRTGAGVVWTKCLSGYTFDGYYTRCTDNRTALLWSPEACDDKRVEIILYRNDVNGLSSDIVTSPSFFATSDELKSGWLVPQSMQWSDGSTGYWVQQPNPLGNVLAPGNYLAGVHFKTECGEYKIYHLASGTGTSSFNVSLIY